MHKRYLQLCLFLLNIVTSCNQSEPQILKSHLLKKGITIGISFNSKGKVYLDYLDSNYRNSVISFINPYNKDTTIFKTIKTDKPTIFNFNFMEGNILFKQPFIGLNINDTIKLFSANDKLTVLPNDSNNYTFCSIIKPQNLKLYFTQYSLDTSKSYHISLLTKCKETLHSINIKINNSDSILKSTIISYVKLQYFTNYLNFYCQNNTEVSNEIILVYDSLKSNHKFLSEFTCPDMKSLLFSVLNFPSNKIKNTNSLTAKLEVIPDLFTKTKYLDGFLLDLIESKSKTVLQRKIYLDSISQFLSPTFNFKFSELKKIPDSILNNVFIDIKSDKKKLAEIIHTQKKIILLDFWASWCKPCLEEIHFLKSKENLFNKDVEIVTLSLDDDDKSWEKAAAKYNLLQNSFKISKETNNSLIQYFSVSSIPRYIVISNDGYLIAEDFYKPSQKDFVINIQKVIESQK